MSRCIEFRSGLRMILVDDIRKLPSNVIEDLNAYQSEKLFLKKLNDAGYVTEYQLNKDNYPVGLKIIIPATTDYSGHPDNDVHITLSAKEKDGEFILSIDHELKEPDEKTLDKANENINRHNKNQSLLKKIHGRKIEYLKSQKEKF